MGSLFKTTGYPVPKDRKRGGALFMMPVVLLAACLIASTGCRGNGPSSTTSVSGRPVGGGPSVQKPTPAQEAAKQRAIQQEPAVTSAIQDMTGNK